MLSLSHHVHRQVGADLRVQGPKPPEQKGKEKNYNNNSPNAANVFFCNPSVGLNSSNRVRRSHALTRFPRCPGPTLRPRRCWAASASGWGGPRSRSCRPPPPATAGSPRRCSPPGSGARRPFVQRKNIFFYNFIFLTFCPHVLAESAVGDRDDLVRDGLVPERAAVPEEDLRRERKKIFV